MQFITLLADITLPDWGEKLTLMGALAFFLYYFMKELKEVRTQMDAMHKEYESKNVAMFERVASMELRSTEALNKAANSYDRLAEAVDSLHKKLES